MLSSDLEEVRMTGARALMGGREGRDLGGTVAGRKSWWTWLLKA